MWVVGGTGRHTGAMAIATIHAQSFLATRPTVAIRAVAPTLLAFATAIFEPAVVNAFHIDPAITVVTTPSFLAHAVDPV